MEQNKFILKAPYGPAGDQPRVIDALSKGLEAGAREQVLLGVTGSGKTYTMAGIIERLNRPTIVLAHNKTLAAQLCAEFREYFPDNAVEYFVSYYDFFQPEAYIPGKDVYIEKDSQMNDEIDRLRHRATSSVLSRNDVIIVSSVSCIYGLGDPAEYKELTVGIRVGMKLPRDVFLTALVNINYNRNDLVLERKYFRVRGDVVEIMPTSDVDEALRIEFFGDELERISQINIVTGEVLRTYRQITIYPASHYVISREKLNAAIDSIELELEERIEFFKSNNKLIEAQRIEERTRYDIEMMREIGFCSGIENYSRIFAGRPPGSAPYTLLDYFPDNYIMFIDESHATIPQVKGMSGGDYARKKNLIDYGFRLPSAFDNRPLFFDEFLARLNQTIYVSATPAAFERERSSLIAEQLIRPTGLVDPEIFVRPTEGQIDDLIGEINKRVKDGERAIVTTLTKKMAEGLTEYLERMDIKVRYIHHNIETLERLEILRDLRAGAFDVIVGINLLREGLDLPEVSLVAILDADSQGLFRSLTSLIQIIGRAARHEKGTVVMYADHISDSMEQAIEETNRRRAIQTEFNRVHGIVPKSIKKEIKDPPTAVLKDKPVEDDPAKNKKLSAKDRAKLIESLTEKMKYAAKNLDFERAALLRDQIKKLTQEGKT